MKQLKVEKDGKLVVREDTLKENFQNQKPTFIIFAIQILLVILLIIYIQG